MKAILQGLENKKWDFSKHEGAAISWLLQHGFEVKLEKQHISKDFYSVSKDGVLDEFIFPNNQKKMNVLSFMEQYSKNFELKKELVKMRADAAGADLTSLKGIFVTS